MMIHDLTYSALQRLRDQWADLGKSAASAAHQHQSDWTTTPPWSVAYTTWSSEKKAIDSTIAALSGETPADMLTSTISALADAGTAANGVKIAWRAIIQNTAFGDGPEMQDPLDLINSIQSFIRETTDKLEMISDPNGDRLALESISGAVSDIATYPVLFAGASDYSPGGGSGSATDGLFSGTSFQAKVDGAIRQVLGRLPSNPANLAAALQQRFRVTVTEGHTDVQYVDGAFGGEGDFGGMIAGGQAAVLSLANGIVNTVQNLIDGFTPLTAAFNQDQADATKAIAKNLIASLYTELGRAGGPLVPKVNILFDSLLVDTTLGTEGEKVTGGYLGYLGHVFGLTDEDLINTLNDEQNATNLQICRESLQSLRVAFNNFVKTSYGTDLGTRFVQLSRALAAASDGLDEVYRSMDRVFVDAAARQVSYFRFGKENVYLQDGLSWIDDFVNSQAKQLVTTGGKRGAEAIEPTAKKLLSLIETLLRAVQYDRGLPSNLRHPAVIRSLQELRIYMRQVSQIALEVKSKPAGVLQLPAAV